MSNLLLLIIVVSGTVILYLTMRYTYARFPIAVLHPVLTSTAIIILLLLVFNVSYESYMVGGKWIEKFLGPSVVALAYPLYNQRTVVIKYRNAIVLGVASGLLTAMGSILLFAKLFQFENEMIQSIIPKSITTPVAIQLSSALGGIPSLTAAFVMIAGFSGVILGPLVMKYTRIQSPLSKGLALGSASHALGVAKSTEYGELSLSMASVSMTLSAVAGSVVGPLFILLL
ncbi:LrgB family protein [Sporosarcina sp. Marseille-Q4063]|uniref:LrgB family protein n=1 Tax=Sporosarcina sp. Marseille-Q4063 TaxID=2810514 RepID=UPI001BAE9B4A|nr:LrgB family protein [Sporosarcina sp. Marseille-Q4063]QUW22445.1 LrgB family protein [Sporosarcina sp. Marseille-Q4063]